MLLADNPWPTGRGERWIEPSEAYLPAAGLSGLHPMNSHCDSTRWGRKYWNRQAYVATASPPGPGASLWETPWRRGRVWKSESPSLDGEGAGSPGDLHLRKMAAARAWLWPLFPGGLAHLGGRWKTEWALEISDPHVPSPSGWSHRQSRRGATHTPGAPEWVQRWWRLPCTWPTSHPMFTPRAPCPPASEPQKPDWRGVVQPRAWM